MREDPIALGIRLLLLISANLLALRVKETAGGGLPM